MTGKPEIAEAGIEAVAGIDPAAIGLALAAASRERADTFLEEQTRLARLQARAATLDPTPAEKSELARFAPARERTSLCNVKTKEPS